MIQPPSAFPLDSGTTKTSPEWYGHEDPKVLAAGHSHSLCLFLALATNITTVPAAVLRGQGNVVDDLYWDSVLAADPTLPLAISFRGNAATRRFLFETERPFTVVHPAVPRTEEYQVIPVEAVRFLMQREATELAGLLERLAGRQCVLLAPPPPKSESSIRRGLNLNTPMASIMRKHGWEPATAQITRLSLRVALHAITFAVLEGVAQDHRVPVLPVPSPAVADDGSLRQQFANADVSHGNTAFGALMWERVAAHFDLKPAHPARPATGAE